MKICDKCGTKTKVTNCRLTDKGFYLRDRICPTCRTVFYTVEVPYIRSQHGYAQWKIENNK
jgi:transcriptional regulator NrdR family protein